MSGYCKYYKQKKQVSYDNGVSWTDTGDYQKGDLYETNSTDCGYVGTIVRWINSGTTCIGYDKYNLQIKQESYDGGSTWINVIPIETRQGTLIERNSTDCGWSPTPATSDEYFSTTALENGTFKFLNVYETYTYDKSMYYSLDDGSTWVKIRNTDNISVEAGQTVLWKSIIPPKSGMPGGIGEFKSTCRFTAQGNVLSLLYGDDFRNTTSINYKYYAFYNLFWGCTGLTSAEYLVLPSTTLVYYCYSRMFYGCTNLTTAPQLPATTLATQCYSEMFEGCTSLTTLPTLPATTLSNYCYAGMFEGCTSLTSIPSNYLQATTMKKGCYGAMFRYCTSLTTALVLPATTLAEECYEQMFEGCRSLTTIPSNMLPATTLAESCYNQMFKGCTSLTTVPSNLLPASTLAEACYVRMFYGCTSLTSAPSLPATTLSEWCYNHMFDGCTSLTTAPVLPATTLVGACYYYMFDGCSSLNNITCLATDISPNLCTGVWVRGVASSGTFTKASSMSDWTRDEDGIPSGWTVQNY